MLYIVPTPIGNLHDITVRSMKTFELCPVVLCEDGRVTSKLFNLLEMVNKPRYVNISKNQQLRYDTIKQVLQENDNVCLVTDAGTPGVSDPGQQIVLMAQEMGLEYTVLPGANAVIPAVVASGFAPKSFEFLGFVPTKKGRLKFIKNLSELEQPAVVYESNHRIEKLLTELNENMNPETRICICRELSKKHEEVIITTVGELENIEVKPKGEFVLVIDKRVN